MQRLCIDFTIPGFVEDIGKSFIKNKIIVKTNEKISSLENKTHNTSFNKLLGKLNTKNQKHIDYFKTQLKNKAHEKIVDVMAKMSDLSCECRKKYNHILKDHFQLKLSTFKQVNDKLTDFMKGQYMETTNKLKKDFRIYNGINALVFLLLIVISFIKPQAAKHLYLPALLLLISSLLCSYFYLFEQNWFFTIIYDDYVGWFYFTYLGIVFALLSDITFNHGRVTTGIIENTIGAISNISIVPC